MRERVSVPITVCIGTYGPYQPWADLVHDRAMPSVDRQTVQPANLRWVHGATLHEARNLAAQPGHGPHGRSEWLCFLDADDELDPGYLEAMAAAAADAGDDDWLLQPATLGVHPGGREDPHPVVIPSMPLLNGNYLVIGTLVKQDQFLRLGGFHDWPIYEDWDLWLRCWRDGATIASVPDAVYRVHVNDDGRNSSSRAAQIKTYRQIRAKHLARAR